MRHENLTIELCLLYKVRQTRAMVHMKVRDQKEFNLFWVDSIKVWELLDAFSTRMKSAVKHNLPALALEIDARSADFASRTKRRDLKNLARLRLDGVCYAYRQFA